MKTVSRLIKYLVIILLLAAAAGYWYIQSLEEPERASPPVPPVTVTKASQEDLKRAITLGGHIESESTVTVLPRVSGLLDALYVDSGDFVERGEKIAEIDPETLKLELKQAESAYKAAESSYERTARLYEANSATRQEYDQAKSQYEAYKAQRDLAELQLKYADITSPMEGVVLQKHTSSGSLVSPEVPIITVGTRDKLKITSRLPERYYDLFEKEKDRMTVEVKRPDAYRPDSRNTVEAQITRISPFISAETKKFDVISRVTQGAELLRPGMYVHVTFILEERKQEYSLPLRALTGRNELWYVEEDTSKARKIILEDPFVTEERFSVPAEYKDKQFIYEGQHFLRDGQQVRITERR